MASRSKSPFRSNLGRTSDQKANADGSTTTTTVSFKPDGGKVIHRKTTGRARSKTPTPGAAGVILPENETRGGAGIPVIPTPRTSNTSSASSAGAPKPKQALEFLSQNPQLQAFVSSLEKVLGPSHADNPQFETAVQRCIPAHFVLLASQDDVTQAQEDYYAMTHFDLPCSNATVRKLNAGSVATCALLQLAYQDPRKLVYSHNKTNKVLPWNCRQIIQEIQSRAHACSKQVAKPTISSSRPLGPPAYCTASGSKASLYAPFYLVPPNYNGTRRALLIGVVKGGKSGVPLQGPPNDVYNLQQFLVEQAGFDPTNIVTLRDDQIKATGGYRAAPSTRQNILDAFEKLVQQSRPGDVCFIQFSGHGGRLGDHLYLVPSDGDTEGHILDDDILLDLIKYMPERVYTTMLVDCCYAGCIGNLPYVLLADKQEGDAQDIDAYYDVDTRAEVIHRKEHMTASELEKEKEKQQARSTWRQVMRIPTVAMELAKKGAAAMSSDTTAKWGQAAVESAKKAGTVATASAKNAVTQFKRAATTTSATPARGAPPKQTKPTSGITNKPPTTLEADIPATKPSTRAAPPKLPPGPVLSKPRGPVSLAPNSPKRRAPRNISSPKPTTPPMTRANTISGPPMRRVKSMQEMAWDAEKQARRTAVAKSQQEAAKERSKQTTKKTRPGRSKSLEELALDQEEAARRAAVAKSHQEAAKERSKQTTKKARPGRSKSLEELASDHEEAARRAAVERSKREAAKARREAAQRTK